MKRLKADLYTPTANDPCDSLCYPAEMLIGIVARGHCDGLATERHAFIVYSDYLATFAVRRGVLPVPGIEKHPEEEHVFTMSPHTDPLAAKLLTNTVPGLMLEPART